jgi:hypothetical protein
MMRGGQLPPLLGNLRKQLGEERGSVQGVGGKRRVWCGSKLWVEPILNLAAHTNS